LVELRTKVIGVYDKGKSGTVQETEQKVVDVESGETYVILNGSAFFVGQGNWGGPKGPPTVNYPPPQGKKPDWVVEHQTTKDSALLYRYVSTLAVVYQFLLTPFTFSLNGDYNPLHATPEVGAKMGFGGAIMHGLSSWNFTCHLVLKTLGNSDPANMKLFGARFASPVKPGDKLVTEIWRTNQVDDEGWEDIRFVTKVEGGKVCLSNGRALKKNVGGGKSKL